MSAPGFRISRLVVTGQNLPNAEIAFEAGFNVLTGPSNTGKSYIVECLDYMLGGQDPPSEDIEESIGYDTAYLELQTMEGNFKTLQRSLLGGDALLHESTFAGRLSVTSRTLAIKTQTKKVETMSSFFLEMMGIEHAEIRTNTYGEKDNLTFRMISHLFLVDETSIIAKKKSPVRLTSGYAKTASERAFSFVITGQDDESVITVQNPKELEAQTAGKKLVYDELIGQLEERLKPFDVIEIESQLATLERTESVSLQRLDAKTGTIQEFQLIRQTAFNRQHAAESRLIVISELLARFSVLKAHYQSDLNRLDFISEGGFFFDQLVAMRCPVCDTLLEQHAAQKLCSESSATLNDVQVACEAEAQKIKAHLLDLEQTVSSLESERAGEVTTSKHNRSEIARVDDMLAKELRPTFEFERQQLDALLVRRHELTDIRSSFSLLEEYRNKRITLDEKIKATKHKFASVSVGSIRGFCDETHRLLARWQFIQEKQVVEFNEGRMDIVIAGKHRSSNGKGLRGFLHGAFNIGLMRYCRANELPHPGFVVLDSPITSYREGKVHEAEDEASIEVQTAFWDDLAQWPKDEQIILVENKEPTEAARTLGHYIHFFGPKSAEGRKGFFPPKEVVSDAKKDEGK